MNDNPDLEQAQRQELEAQVTTFSTEEESTTEEEDPLKNPAEEKEDASTTEEEDAAEKMTSAAIEDGHSTTEEEEQHRLVRGKGEVHMLRESINPFAVRPGHRLDFTNINVTVKKRNKDDQQILRNVCGSVLPKRVCCVMGASGSGTWFSFLCFLFVTLIGYSH